MEPALKSGEEVILGILKSQHCHDQKFRDFAEVEAYYDCTRKRQSESLAEFLNKYKAAEAKHDAAIGVLTRHFRLLKAVNLSDQQKSDLLEKMQNYQDEHKADMPYEKFFAAIRQLTKLKELNTCMTSGKQIPTLSAVPSKKSKSKSKKKGGACVGETSPTPVLFGNQARKPKKSGFKKKNKQQGGGIVRKDIGKDRKQKKKFRPKKGNQGPKDTSRKAVHEKQQRKSTHNMTLRDPCTRCGRRHYGWCENPIFPKDAKQEKKGKGGFKRGAMVAARDADKSEP